MKGLTSLALFRRTCGSAVKRPRQSLKQHGRWRTAICFIPPLMSTGIVKADSGKERTSEKIINAVLDRDTALLKDTASHFFDENGEQISFGLVTGVPVGFALKKSLKAAALLFGVVAMGLQGLAYSGIVSVDYDKIKRSGMGFLDQDNDGKFDSTDVKLLKDKVMRVLEHKVPYGAGFGVGIAAGFRYG
ncbi:unnamed protein product [Chrysoparadoxa australica]